MKYIFCLLVCVLSINNSFASATENHEIRAVIKAFDETIQNKDKEQFLDLFIEKGVSWVGVFSEEDFVVQSEIIKKYNKDNNENHVVTRYFVSSPQKFIEHIVSEKTSSKEEFTNVQINSDGNIATVYFDYVFYRDNKKQNWGSESWQLVKTTKGWKINAVNFSYNTKG